LPIPWKASSPEPQSLDVGQEVRGPWALAVSFPIRLLLYSLVTRQDLTIIAAVAVLSITTTILVI